jgi:hypothetical protein
MSDQNQQNNTPPAAPAAAKGVEVRMLVDHKVDAKTTWPCNTVQVVDAATAKSMKDGGIADPTPAAVAACKAMQPKKDEDGAVN